MKRGQVRTYNINALKRQIKTSPHNDSVIEDLFRHNRIEMKILIHKLKISRSVSNLRNHGMRFF